MGAPPAAPVETAGVGERAAADGEAGTDGAGAARELSPAAPTSPTRDDDPLTRLLEGGLELLGELARAARTPVGDGGRAAQADGVFRVARDPDDGRGVPPRAVAPADVLSRALAAVAGLVERLRNDR